MPELGAGRSLLFIIGTGRCGSTVVQELLTHHPDIGFVSNVDTKLAHLALKGRWNSLLYERAPSELSRRDKLHLGLIQRRFHYGPSEAYRLLSREVSPLVSEPFRDLTADDVTPWLEKRFRSFFETRVRAQRTPAFLHKFTGWPRAGFIHAVFPEARYLHVIRDGRAVASSLMQRPWWRGYLGPTGWGFGPLPEEYEEEWERSGRSFVALAGIEWKLMMDAFDKARATIPDDRWMEVRYEDFVEHPREHTDRALRLIGLEWTQQFEAAFAAYPVSVVRRQSYRGDLTAAQVVMLDQILGEELRKRGYTTGDGTAQAGPETGTSSA